MRISYNWLKDYVSLKGLSAEKLAELLTMSGLAVESVDESDGDYIYEIEVTSNRPDALSVIGVAREYVYYLTLALVSPLGSYNDCVCHIIVL